MDSEKTAQTVQLPFDKTPEAIADALSQIKLNPEETDPAKLRPLRGKFIILPNVKSGGYKTLLRRGHHTAYSDMPIVGGYIEKCLYSELEVGDRNILDGKVPAWGSKAIGIFQTSDCRGAEIVQKDGRTWVNFVGLGKWPTWVKWAKPSTEALRQACLARTSRITHQEPAVPLLQIVGVAVSDSSFLGPVTLGINPQFNAFIGGRGTGKSSLLEYIRWALCDDPLSVAEWAELPNFDKRRKALIDGTLRPKGATVTVFYKKNEIVYRIERVVSTKADAILVYDQTGACQALAPQQVKREFPIVSYAQKQLSCVGTLPDEINRLITAPVKEPMAQIQDKIEKTLLPQIKQQRARRLKLAGLAGRLEDLAMRIKTKRAQVQALQQQLQSLNPEQQRIIESHDILSQRDQWLATATERPKTVSGLLTEVCNKVDALGNLSVPPGLPDNEKVQHVATDSDRYLAKVTRELRSLAAEVDLNAWLESGHIQDLDDMRVAFKQHQTEYDRCIAESAKNKEQLDEISNLNGQIVTHETEQSSLRSEHDTLQAAIAQHGTIAWDQFLASLDERADLLRVQCQVITDQAQHEFRPTVAYCADEQPVKAAMQMVIQGRNVKNSDQKVDALAAAVSASAHPIKQWQAVMAELDSLCQSRGPDPVPDLPLLEAAGFTDDNFQSIRNAVAQETLEQIRFLNINDQIEFMFRMGKGADGQDHYIPFNSASPGQQATCLLRTLLAQSGAPLLIDQPEEDLDNEQIHVLAERIATTKHNRQLVFVSHNANIVVNGDAELVVCFGYLDAGDNTCGKIDPVGSIDCAPVREAITRVMEGGRQAFELRKSKYGF